MNNCIINFADGIHTKVQKRLIDSLKKVGYKDDIIFYSQPDVLHRKDFPKQEVSPWGFKPYMFIEAQKKGYKKILWIDSSVICIRNPKKIFKLLNKQGYFIFSKKVTKVSDWSSEYSLKKMGINRKTAEKIPEIRAHVLGLNLDFKIAKDFLNEWYKCSKDNITFRGLPIQFPLSETFHNKNNQISLDSNVFGHRHDQTIASIIANNLGMKLTKKYSVDYEGEIKNTINPIEYDCIFLHDRSYKTEHLKNIDWSENKKNILTKILYFIYSLIYTNTKRVIKLILR